ncbi:MAG: class I SAM-dependent methyltransferase [Phaeodactylibacter sp.]|nr:class I SAM-dependent methyltransferase [Phaeodactylibacter sp.]MCB9049005.1 class I SAM-dependent methyltransferase [Lewinellaceae bacterium]
MDNYLTPEEKQYLLLLGWFRRHYALYLGLERERPATGESILQFGRAWFGNQLLDLASAFPGLKHKQLIREEGGAIEFTEAGASQFAELDASETFYRYEYDNFFSLSEKSEAHALFCERVYGKNLNQHGLSDTGELRQLLAFLDLPSGAYGLDLGCGNGLITDYLQRRSGARFLGVDISPEAIRRAEQIRNPHLAFRVSNMNALSFSEPFDFIVSVDTLYYAADLSATVRDCLSNLRPGGIFACFFSQWINAEGERPFLEGTHTGLAKVLRELEQPFEFQDISESGRKHWRLKRDVLLDMRPDFEAEGNLALWDYRFREANRYAQWPADFYARFIYRVDKPA